MKKLISSILILSIMLCGCADNAETKSTEVQGTEAQVAETSTTEVATEPTTETTTAEAITPTVPEIDTPDVVSAEKYEKKIIDMLDSEYEWDYPHSVEYPKIDSEKAGAVALNEKIAEKYVQKINELKSNKEGRNVYNFYYTSSACDGIIFINIIENTGWQYSEGMTEQRIFYYDAENDKELTADEYAAHFGIDLDKASEGVLYSYELACSYMDDTSVVVDENDTAMIEPAAGYLSPAKQSEFYYGFDGLEVTDGEVNMYYSGMQYVKSIYKIALDRETLSPKYPHYMGYINADENHTKEIKITFKNGEVVDYSLPKDSGIYNITIMSTMVIVRSTEHIGDWQISINGGERYTPGGQMLDGENTYRYDYYTREYLAPEDIQTIELFGYQPNNAPAVVCADSYTKTAIDTLSGGEFDFVHKVEYPLIDSAKPGAEALNEKIAQKYSRIVNELSNNQEKQYLYDISFESSTYDDLIFIRIDSYSGWQYSEGSCDQEIYYYDATLDKEISTEEYCEKLGIDLEKASHGVLASYDLAYVGYGGETSYLCEKIGGEPVGAPITDTIYYCAYDNFNETVELKGVEQSGVKINLYYTGQAYIQNNFKCAVEKGTYLPENPNYAGYIMPDNATESDDIDIIFRIGKVAEYSMPAECGIDVINFSASHIDIHSKKQLNIDTFSINQGEIEWGYSASFDDGDYIYSYHIPSYYPINMLWQITFTLK